MNPKAIENLPEYKRLIRLRARMVWALSFALIMILLGNLYLMSFGSDYGDMIITGEVISLVTAYSVFTIIAGALSCAFYVWWANRNLDPLVESIATAVEQDTDFI